MWEGYFSPLYDNLKEVKTLVLDDVIFEDWLDFRQLDDILKHTPAIRSLVIQGRSSSDRWSATSRSHRGPIDNKFRKSSEKFWKRDNTSFEVSVLQGHMWVKYVEQQ